MIEAEYRAMTEKDWLSSGHSLGIRSEHHLALQRYIARLAPGEWNGKGSGSDMQDVSELGDACLRILARRIDSQARSNCARQPRVYVPQPGTGSGYSIGSADLLLLRRQPLHGIQDTSGLADSNHTVYGRSVVPAGVYGVFPTG